MTIVFVNFKTYKEATGEKAVALAKICEKVAKKTGEDIFVVVQNADLFRVAKSVSIPVYAEHVDPFESGAHTGKDIPEALLENGAAGVMINHSEDRSELSGIEESIKRARGLSLKTLVCAPTAESSEAIAVFSPDFIAVEPPELIGGDVSVSKARPELVSETVKKVKKIGDIPVLCGAGIKDHKDVTIAVDLGCDGILIASGVTKSKNPEKELLDLVGKRTRKDGKEKIKKWWSKCLSWTSRKQG